MMETCVKYDDFSDGGISPPVLSRPVLCSLDSTGTTGGGAVPNDSGYLYYPSATSKAAIREKKKPTKNRKTITYSRIINHADTTYTINNGASGMYSHILHRLIDELDAAINLWGRVFVLRFDLHHKDIKTTNNKWLSRLFKNLKRRLERAYGMSKIGYGWVREEEKGKAQHYHAVLYLDGDKIRHSGRINKIISETWEAINPANFTYHPENQFYFIGSQSVREEAVHRISYLAKVRGKGYRAKQVKDFYCSSLG